MFELIQNANDNSYSSAETKNQVPFLLLSLSPQSILVDSNEDGFREDNVRAICKVAESTKQGIRGYVGEKGIGFKSVFTVASMVHIQSEPFSWCFYHRPQDDNMSMITPHNKDFDSLPADVNTRISLTLKEDLDTATLAQEFRDLPGTSLLFLKTLKRLRIRIDKHDQYLNREYCYQYNAELRQGRLIETDTRLLGTYTTKTSRFLIEKKSVRDLPPDTSRKDITDAEVILAFEVDENGLPVIAEQYVFAYLPIRQAGLSVRPLSLISSNHFSYS